MAKHLLIILTPHLPLAGGTYHFCWSTFERLTQFLDFFQKKFYILAHWGEKINCYILKKSLKIVSLYILNLFQIKITGPLFINNIRGRGGGEYYQEPTFIENLLSPVTLYVCMTLLDPHKSTWKTLLFLL